jgi:hypothetical protein
MHTPGVGVVWDSDHEPQCLGFRFSYPLKTSRRCTQFWCGIPRFSSGFLHVAFTSWVNFLSLLILVAIILSEVSLSLITFIHLALTSCSECCLLFLWMTLSHLSTHIRWLASDIRICSSLVRPFVLVKVALCSLARRLSFSGPSGRDMCPILSMVPIVMLGHCCHSCGHSSLAFFHIIFRASTLHSSRMCCIDSILLQVLHSCLCSKSRTSFHRSPIMKA